MPGKKQKTSRRKQYPRRELPLCDVTEKRCYSRWSHAESDMKSIARKEGAPLSAWCVYECADCKWLHIGHKPWYIKEQEGVNHVW